MIFKVTQPVVIIFFYPVMDCLQQALMDVIFASAVALLYLIEIHECFVL